MKKIILALLLAPVVSVAQVADPEGNGGSLTPAKYHSPFKTRTARSVGDVVTIIISENSVAQFQGNTQATKKDTNTIGPNNIPLVDFLRVGLLDTVLRSASTGADSSVQGGGQTNAQGRFTARMAAVVREVLPNGTLVIEGTRTVKINRETQNLVLSGVIRQDDVRADNTILSENVANAMIQSEGIGLIYDRQRRGLLTKLLEWLF